VFHAACGVVERDWLNLTMMAEEVAALVERHRMREHLAQCAELHAWGSDHIVHDAQPEFALNEDVSCHQKIGMLGDCASQGVLNGDYGSGDRSALQSVEYFDGARARHDPAASQHLFGGFVAEGTEFALDRNFNGSAFHYMARYLENGAKRKLTTNLARLTGWLGEVFLQHQRIDAVRIIAGEGFDYAVAVAFIERQGGNVVHRGLQLDRAAPGRA
jgi:hypothetical protein